MSISRANLPDALDVGANQSRRSRKTSPTDDGPSQESDTKTSAVHDERSAPTQSVFPSHGIPSSPSPNPHLSPQFPNQYIHQDLPIHPSHTPSSSSPSLQDLKRKRAQVDTDQPVTTPPSLGFYPPFYIASHPQQPMPDAFESPSNYPNRSISTTGLDGTEPFGQHMDSYGFPYYFENFEN